MCMRVEGAVSLYNHHSGYSHCYIVHCHHPTGRPESRVTHCSDNAHRSKGSRSGSSAGSSCPWSPSVYNNPQLSFTFPTLTHISWNNPQVYLSGVCSWLSQGHVPLAGRPQKQCSLLITSCQVVPVCPDLRLSTLIADERGVCQASPQSSPYFPCFCNKTAFCR